MSVFQMKIKKNKYLNYNHCDCISIIPDENAIRHLQLKPKL